MPRVTSAFSLCPQPPSTVRPGIRRRASRTIARGIGAPKQQKSRREERSRAADDAVFRVSCRNGVAADVEVIRCFSTSAVNSSAFQTSW